MEKIKKISKLFFVIALIFAMNVSTSTKASEIPVAPEDFGQPIEVNVYEEDDGSIVTEKIYFVPDEDSDGISLHSSSGKGYPACPAGFPSRTIRG